MNYLNSFDEYEQELKNNPPFKSNFVLMLSGLITLVITFVLACLLTTGVSALFNTESGWVLIPCALLFFGAVNALLFNVTMGFTAMLLWLLRSTIKIFIWRPVVKVLKPVFSKRSES